MSLWPGIYQNCGRSQVDFVDPALAAGSAEAGVIP
jgi:hypothetical protein